MTYQEALEKLEAFMNGKGTLNEAWYNTAADALTTCLECELERITDDVFEDA